MSKHNITPQNDNHTLFIENLEIAIKFGKLKDVQLLLDLKLDDKHINAALEFAAKYNYREVSEKLQRESYNSICDGDSVAGDWFYAAHQNDASCIRKLLSTTRIDLNIQDNKGQTALHITSNRYGKIAKLLLCLSNFDPNIQDYEGNTVLHKALQNGNLALCSALLNHKKTNPNIFNYDGDSALNFAINKENIAMLSAIINHDKTNLNAQNRYGNTILHHAVLEAIKALRDNPEYDLSMINLLLDHHIDTNIQNLCGMTALHSVVENKGDPILIKLLVNFGANYDLVDNSGQTVYEIAKQSNINGVHCYNTEILNLIFPISWRIEHGSNSRSSNETQREIDDSDQTYHDQYRTLAGQDNENGAYILL